MMAGSSFYYHQLHHHQPQNLHHHPIHSHSDHHHSVSMSSSSGTESDGQAHFPYLSRSSGVMAAQHCTPSHCSKLFLLGTVALLLIAANCQPAQAAKGNTTNDPNPRALVNGPELDADLGKKCQQYGHSCLGGHGKRSSFQPQPIEIGNSPQQQLRYRSFPNLALLKSPTSSISSSGTSSIQTSTNQSRSGPGSQSQANKQAGYGEQVLGGGMQEGGEQIGSGGGSSGEDQPSQQNNNQLLMTCDESLSNCKIIKSFNVPARHQERLFHNNNNNNVPTLQQQKLEEQLAFAAAAAAASAGSSINDEESTEDNSLPDDERTAINEELDNFKFKLPTMLANRWQLLLVPVHGKQSQSQQQSFNRAIRSIRSNSM